MSRCKASSDFSDCTDPVEVQVRSIAYGGDGVARLADGMTLFVPFAAVGDRLRVRVAERHKRFARGAIEEVLQPGRGRVTPVCPYYGRCGGCRCQHLSAEEQVRLKAEQLPDLLTRIGGLRDLPPVEGARPAPRPYGYRNKITLTPVPGARRATGWGYLALDNVSVVEIAHCPLAHADLNARLAGLAAPPSTTVPLLSPPPAAGAVAPAAPHGPVSRESLVLRRDSTGKVLVFQTPPAATLTETVLERSFAVSAGGFFQVNPPVLEQLLAWLREAYRPAGDEAFVDAYCGCGVFAIGLGAGAREVIGIESDPAATAHAAANARAAGIPNARFIAGEVERELDRVLRAQARPSRVVLLLDPPRAGLAEGATELIRRHRPGTVVYVSCEPATLARDLKRLQVGAAYSLRRLALFDMFPQTAHFESVAFLTT